MQMNKGAAARSTVPRRPLLTVVAWALLWGFLGWLPISMTGVGATLGEQDVASRRQRLAIGAGAAGLVLGGIAGFLAAHHPERWRRFFVGAVTGAVVGFVSMRWDIGQPDPAGNAMKAACVYAAIGATAGLRKSNA
jgi:hypothetical protein